jgi:hypothetical protein
MTPSSRLELPSGLTTDSVLRIGLITASIRVFIQTGMVVQEGSSFVQLHDRPPDTPPELSKGPDPFSLQQLQMRGYKVIPGKTDAENQVMVWPGTYFKIPYAIEHGLLKASPHNSSTLKDTAP